MSYNVGIVITNPNKTTNVGAILITVRYKYNGKYQKIYIPTDYKASRSKLKNQKISGTNSKELNLLINKRILTIHDKLSEVDKKKLSLEPNDLKNFLLGISQLDKRITELVEFTKKTKLEKGQINVSSNYETLLKALKKFEEYQGCSQFSDVISQQFINDFHKFLKNDLRLFPNTISEYLILFKRVIRFCNRNNLVDINLDRLDFTIKKIKTTTVALSPQELELFLKYRPDPKKKDEQKVYDFALIIFFAGGGIRFDDLRKIYPDNIHEKTITFRWKKNINTKIEIHIEDNLDFLLKKYSYDIRSACNITRDDFNYKIKLICKKIGFFRLVENAKGLINENIKDKAYLWEKVSSNTFRKTTISFLANDYTLKRVMEISGHSQIKSVQSYMANDSDSVRNTVKEFTSKFFIGYRLDEDINKISLGIPDDIDWEHEEFPDDAS